MRPILVILLPILYALVTFVFVEVSQIGTVSVAALILVLILSFIEIRIALAVLPVVFALSPKMPIGGVPLQIEDFLIPILLVVFLLRIFLLREEVHWSHLFWPIGAILFVNLSTTFWGLYNGYLSPTTSFFRNLKVIEYVIIFFLVSNILKTRKDARRFAWYLLLGGMAGGIYGTVQHFLNPGGPVTGPPGEDYNTFAGFLLFYIALSLVVYTRAEIPRERWLAGATLLLTLFPFVYSFSRTSYVAFVIMLLYLGFRRTRAAFVLLGGAVIGYLLFLPAPLVERVASILEIVGGGASAPPAFLARLDAWKWIFDWIIIRNPVFGDGIGRVTLMIDSEFLRILAETGMVGLVVFLWFIGSLLRLARRLAERPFPDMEERILAAVPAALSAIVIAFFIHSLGSTTFTTIRTMEPFWFLIGILVVIMKVEEHPERRESVHVRAA